MMDLSLRYEYNGTDHDDIVLSFAGQTWVCDSYYFAIDRNLQPDDDSPAKVMSILLKLLEQWQNSIANLMDRGVSYLPFDFSDQGTGWLCCRRYGDDVIVSKGHSLTVQGWSIFPSAVGQYLDHLPDFEVDGPTIRSSRESLLQAIRGSLALAA